MHINYIVYKKSEQKKTNAKQTISTITVYFSILFRKPLRLFMKHIADIYNNEYYFGKTYQAWIIMPTTPFPTSILMILSKHP